MSKIYKVYKHINKINNKVYIGLTCQKPQERWKNGSGYSECPKFWNAIQKYGWNNFEHIVLFDHLTREEAEEIEIELIAYHKSINDEFGYNIQNGGNTTGTHSNETKRKIAESNRRRIISEETRQKMSDNHANFKGENSVWYGRHHTEQTKQKISLAKKGQLAGEKNPMYGKRGKDSPNFGRKHTIEARKKMSIANKGKIVSEETREKLRKNSWPAKNKGNIKFTEEHKRKIGDALRGEKSVWYGTGKKVICLETNVIYNSAKWASKELSLDSSSITKVCRGKLKTTGGLHFKYYEVL